MKPIPKNELFIFIHILFMNSNKYSVFSKADTMRTKRVVFCVLCVHLNWNFIKVQFEYFYPM